MKTDSKKGLSYEQVKQRQTEGKINYDTTLPTKSIKKYYMTIFSPYLT